MINRCLFILSTLLLCSGLLVMGTLPVFAGVASEFTINLFVGIDTTPPTTPVLLAATPIAATQINIEWSAATDDVLLSGYRVYRNGIAIATTTLLSFSDSGLIASTLYSYSIDAFDSFFNISTTSNAIATSTFATPLIPLATTSTETSRTTSGSRASALQAFLLTPTQTRAYLTWQTFGMTSYVLKWGRTTSYDSGSISKNVFSQQHATEVTDLEPGTKYYFELTAINPFGLSRVIKTDSFFTLAALSSSLPVNVEGFKARVNKTDINLSWRKGNLPEGAVIRIVRSHLYYPNSIGDGSLVFEGIGEQVIDIKALSIRSPQYYTAFVITPEGVVSSGAIAVAGRLVEPLPPTEVENPAIETGDELILRASSVVIIQGRKHFTLDATAPLQADTNYLISIPVQAVKPGLKSIIVSVQNPSNQREVSRYLFKINQAGDAYVATLPAPLVTGQSRLQVEVFDYSAQQVRQITTSISFVRTDNPPVEFPDGLVPSKLFIVVTAGVVSSLLGISLWWLLIVLRRRRREDNP